MVFSKSFLAIPKTDYLSAYWRNLLSELFQHVPTYSAFQWGMK